MDLLRNARSLTAVLHAHAQSMPDRVAITYVNAPDVEDGHVTQTYAQLDLAARRLGFRLRESRRVAAGDRVLLQYPSGVEFAVAYFGSLYAGLIPIPAPLPANNKREQLRIRGMVHDAGVQAILTDSGHCPAVVEWAATESLTGVFVVATNADGAVETSGGMTAPNGDPQLSGPAADPDMPAMLQYTSGAVSEPKGVVISHGNLLHNVASIGEAFPMPLDGQHGGWIPMYHDMGLIGHLLTGVLLGRGCVLMDAAAFIRRPHHWLWMIDRFHIVHSAAPNFAYELCTRRIRDEQIAGIDLSRWKYACNGSEPVHAGTLRDFAARFAPYGLRPDALVPSYGMAENTLFVAGTPRRTPVICHVDAGQLERHTLLAHPVATETTRELVSCGELRAAECVIADPATGTPLPADHVGEIWLRGPSVAHGYWNNPDATTRTFGATLTTTAPAEPYLRTGDLGVLHGGELYVTGRIKETLLINGRNLYPQDIEHELRSRHDELRTLPGAAFAINAEPGAPYAEALVVTQEFRGQWAEEQFARLVADMKQTVSREFGLPVARIALLRPGTIRRTTSGKIQRTAMRELFLSDALQPLYAG